jgi:hypothetical protein
MLKHLLVTSALVTAAVAQVGCADLECGPGTIERNGECQAADESTVNATCGPGTKLSGDHCVPIATCDPETTTIVDGVCKGSGEFTIPASCADEYPCPGGGTTMSICGRIHDLETDDVIALAGNAVKCNPDAPAADGPCSVKYEFYDAANFATGQMMQLDYKVGNVIYDTCGRFRVTGLGAPATGVVAVGARATAASRKTTGITIKYAAGGAAAGVSMYSTRTTTDTKLGTAAGAGTSLAANGAIVSLFAYKGSPVMGVTLNEPKVFYFTDASKTSRSMVGGTATGMNGAAIVLQKALGPVIATGGLPAGCDWGTEIPQNAYGATVKDVIYVQQRSPFMGSNACP